MVSQSHPGTKGLHLAVTGRPESGHPSAQFHRTLHLPALANTKSPGLQPQPPASILTSIAEPREQPENRVLRELRRCGGAPEAPVRASTMAKKNRRERARGGH